MAHQRAHREAGDLEVGATDVFMRRPTPHVAARAAKPEWFQTWENRRPRWLMECIAEAFVSRDPLSRFFSSIEDVLLTRKRLFPRIGFATNKGVALYCWGGMGASAAFYVTAAAKEQGFGALLNVGLCYAFAIALAIILVGPTSGSHLNPCFTIAFAVYKGFPWRKVPQYIISQILGGMIGGLVVYWQYKPALDAITAELRAAGAGAAVFSTTGPASPIALFVTPGQPIGNVFVNEFIGAMVISIAVFSVLDPSNIFVNPASAPLLIGLAYFVTITCFAVNSVALNTARDLGGRLAAACIWGTGVFPARYTAITCLTNILASLVGAGFQTFFLSDLNRPHVHIHPSADDEDDMSPTVPKQRGQQMYEKNGSDTEHMESR